MEWFLPIWESGEIKDILRFNECEEVWSYVVENNIKKYVVHKGDCVIDNS